MVCFFYGRHFEALRWSQNAELNGSRIFFRNKSYKVVQLPMKPSERDR